VRFAFAIATAVEPEILLLDEVFSAVDRAFQQKARVRMASLIDKARLLVFVSHDMPTIEELCNRVIWMDKGAIVDDGDPRDVLKRYAERHAAGQDSDPVTTKELTEVESRPTRDWHDYERHGAKPLARAQANE